MNTRTLLQAGVVAGPIFTVVVVAQLLTRDGFDIMHQPLSLLSVGAAGWVQIANFIVAGLLSCAFAAGLSRVLATGPGSTWGSRLIALFGVGLVAGDVLTPDPALGYPVGTPDVIPQSFTWHAMVHAVVVGFSWLTAFAIHERASLLNSQEMWTAMEGVRA